MDTPTPVGTNEQQVWGGNVYRYPDPSGTLTVEQAAHVDPPDPGSVLPPSSQAHLLASSSDDLFHPVPGGPSFVPYRLPPVPNNTAYTLPFSNHIPVNRSHLSQPPVRFLPYPTSASSYNNPAFTIPSQDFSQPNYQQHPSHFQPVSSAVPLYHSQPQHTHFTPPFSQPPPLSVSPVPAAYMPHHNSQIPAQYVYYVPQPSSSPAPSFSSSPSKALPSVTHIPTLTNKIDFFAWDEGVTALLCAHGLFGHILDSSAPLDPSRPDLAPAPLPVLPVSPSAADLAALSRWWVEDNAAQHILVSKIGSIPRGLLPSSNLVARTALSIYQTLVRYYGTCSYSDCAVLLNSLHGTPCQPGRVQEFVSKWRTGLSRLRSTTFPFSIKMCINQFVCGLPNIPAFNSLRSDLPDRVASAGDQNFGAFIALTEKVLELDVIFKSILPQASQARSRSLPSSLPPPAASVSLPSSTSSPIIPSTAPAASAGAVPYSLKLCSNCGRKGHLAPTCFEPGGGMEGRRADFKRDRNKVVAMLIADLGESLASDQLEPPASPMTPVLDTLPADTLDDIVLIPTMANLSVSTALLAQNNNLHRDLYKLCEPLEPFSFALHNTSELEHTAYLSLGSRFNSCLDSGCTDHIITDRRLFQTYDTSGAVEIGTANCGSLSTKASGDVSFRVPFQDRFVIFTLRGCLHAPDAPLHLLSVGALNEQGLKVTFNAFGAPTILSCPTTDPELPGFSMSAEVIRRLSFLNLDFIFPSDIVRSQAFPALTFPQSKLTLTLWH